MRTYEFTLNFTLSNSEQDPAELVENLYGEGCSDALLGIGRLGQLSLMFAREANSAQWAVFSAIKDVQSVVADARLHSLEPDLVGLSDLAHRLGFSRQYMRKLMDRNPDFPVPIHQGNPSLWHLFELLNWLITRKDYDVSEELLQIAQVTRQLNVMIQEASVEAEFREQARMRI
jgi:hypothetical protein